MPARCHHVGAHLAQRGQHGQVGGDHHHAASRRCSRRRPGRRFTLAMSRLGGDGRHPGVAGHRRQHRKEPERHASTASVWSPATASMKSDWFTAPISARRTAGLSKGGCRQLKRSIAGAPVGSSWNTLTTAVGLELRARGRAPAPATSPSAPSCSAGGRGRDVRDGVPLQAVEVGDLRPGGPIRRAGRARRVAVEALEHGAGRRAPVRPPRSGTGRCRPPRSPAVNASVLASRSGIIGHMLLATLPSASGSSGKGRLSRNTIVLSSRRRQLVGRGHQRAAERVALGPTAGSTRHESRARTGSPSWKRSPSRRIRVPAPAVILDGHGRPPSAAAPGTRCPGRTACRRR